MPQEAARKKTISGQEQAKSLASQLVGSTAKPMDYPSGLSIQGYLQTNHLPATGNGARYSFS